MHLYWLEQTQAEVPEGDAWLSGAEVSLQERLRFAKRRNDWRLGRWTAKVAVASYLHSPFLYSNLALIEVRAEPSGAPQAFIVDNRFAETISLSHCNGRAICLVASSQAAMGCDLEAIEARGPAFFDDYFTSSEQSWIGAAPEAHHPKLTTLVWSAKESALKALRVGLRSPTRSVIVSPIHLSPASEAEISADTRQENPDRWYPLRVDSQGGCVFSGWWRYWKEFVYTVVSDASADPPIRLEVARPADLAALTTIRDAG